MASTTPARRLTLGESLFPRPVRRVSLYIHIPFCSSRCRYCDFYFETGWSPRVMGRTLDRIVEEGAYLFAQLGGPRVSTVYVGGGTPSVIPPRQLDDFLVRLRAALSIGGTLDEPDEWSFEANPESVSAELLAVLRERGVSRLSLGVQSFHDPLLRSLTRRATGARIVEALELIDRLPAAKRFPHLNLDLIVGIPGQSRELVLDDIERALAFTPDHLSVYSLTVEERTPLAQMVARGEARELPPERQEELWFAARDALLDRGFEHYEVSNFARPGARSLHNRAYWRLDPYIGLGPGGVSTIPVAPGPGVARLTNPNLFLYSSASDPSWKQEVELLSPKALLLEHFLTGLRTSDGVSLSRLKRIFGLDLARRWVGPLAEWAARGAVRSEALEGPEPRLVLTEDTRMMLDRFVLEVDRLIDETEPVELRRWPDEVHGPG